jgi:hypothetical protein
MVSGQWSVVNGQWSVVSGQWSMVSGQWSMVTGNDKRRTPNSECGSCYLDTVSRLMKMRTFEHNAAQTRGMSGLSMNPAPAPALLPMAS